MDMMMTMGMIGAAMNGVPKGVQIDPSKAPGMSFSPGWYGTPEQALAGIEAIHGRRHGPRRVHRRRYAEDAARGGGRVASADGRDDGSRTARRSLLVGGRLMAGEKLVEKSVEADGFRSAIGRKARAIRLSCCTARWPGAVGCARPAVGENRVLLFELPGWGEQPNDRSQSLADLANTVVAAMDALGLERAHVMGTSLGGAVALHLALDHPERVISMVLESPAAFRSDRSRRRACRPSR